MNPLLAILTIFVHPAASVRYQKALGGFAWFPPFVLAVAASAAGYYLLRPLMLPVIRAELMQKLPPDQVQQALDSATASMNFGAIFSPLMLLIMLGVSAGLVVAFSTIAGIRVLFTQAFVLLAHASLIPMSATLLQFGQVRSRGVLHSMQELQPVFGLDLLLASDAPRLLRALLNYFSMFTIWYIVVLALGYAALTGVPKLKAFFITSPVWLLGLVFALAAALAA